MRVLSLFLPRLSTDRLLRPDRLRRRREGRAEGASPERPPLAVVAMQKNAMRVVAVDRIAEKRGIRLGLTLADARGAVPDLEVVEADEPADRALLEKIADWCDRYTPLVALDPPNGLFLDISGCAHLFAASKKLRAAAGDDDGEADAVAIDDGEAALLADCLGRLTRQGFAARGAIASSVGAAWAVARYGDGTGDGSGGNTVPPGGEAEAVAGLPVAALRIGPGDVALLDRLGLKRIGQLIGKPRAPLTARFGPRLVAHLDQVLARADEVVAPRRPPPQLSAERRFPEPILHQEALLETVRGLARALEPALVRHGLGARLVEASAFHVDGTVARVSVGTVAPLRSADAVAMLFAERLSALGSEWESGFGFDMVRLAVLATDPYDAAQIDLAGAVEGEGSLAHLADRLGARLGLQRVVRFIPVDTHIPERAVEARPLAASAVSGTSPLRRGQNLRSEAKANFGRGVDAEALPDDGEAPPDRPLRLFARPEPVEVLAEVPEGPPLRFRWRRVMHEVARAEGPERIAPEWWRPGDGNGDRPTRDYYRVEDSAGRRYWIFREGLYGRESGLPVWYVHGLFG